jgi:hypothetical protein
MPESTKRIEVAGNTSAPFVYFDQAAVYGVQAGVIQAELVAGTILPEGTGTKPEVIVTCHLRCSVEAAKSLIGALTSALSLLEKPSDPLKTN